jgi:nucleotide-binding universal stress UspA family protein
METQEQTYRMVVGADGSELGDMAVIRAFEVARDRPRAEIHAIHVATDAELEDAPGASRLEKQDYLLETIPHEMWARLERLAYTMPQPPGELRVSVHMRFGPAHEVIHQVAVDYDADLIIVGTHGRHGLERMVLGSVAEKLVRMAHCPVLVVRPKSYEGLEKTERMEAAPSEPPHPEGKQRQPRLYTATRDVVWSGRQSGRPPGMRMF